MILGQSKSILKVNALIHKVAKANASILITGESGTGKELVARMIHQESDVSRSPFVAVNCGAIPESLIESELFGHKRGSFTGAVADKIGLFQAAEDGTLFLDEIGELPLSMQVKLLRALQERKVRRVGDNEDQKVSARIIAATNRDLEIEVSQGRFREDLYYRLNVIQITTPPLRDRDDDILLLADYFLNQLAKKKKATPKKLTEEVKDLFKSYSWPGNVREFDNTL